VQCCARPSDWQGWQPYVSSYEITKSGYSSQQITRVS
jgi:hypothetical protein